MFVTVRKQQSSKKSYVKLKEVIVVHGAYSVSPEHVATCNMALEYCV
jgi:hypothetical protein